MRSARWGIKMIYRSQKSQHRLLFSSLLLVLIFVISGCHSGGGSSSTYTPDTDDQNGTTPEPSDQPKAVIAASDSFISGETVTLNGSDSSNPGGGTFSYQWAQTEGPTIDLSNNSNPTVSFVAPTVEQPTKFSFELTVDDGENSDTATVSVLISPLVDNTAPSITSRSPGPDQTGVLVSTKVSVSFDEALLDSSVDSQSLTLMLDNAQVSGSASYDEQTHSILFTPTAQLSEETIYTVNLGNSAQDLARNFVSTESWSFTTATASASASQYNLGSTPQETIDLCMDTGDKEMLTLVNNARAVSRSCGSTNYPAAAPLAWHCGLETVAQEHTTIMAENDLFTHTAPGEPKPDERITSTGDNWKSYGENIASGYLDEEEVIEGWLDSQDHCMNLMDALFTDMGAASAQSESTSKIYWTHDFASQ